MSRLIVVTFAHGKYIKAQQRHKEQALKYGADYVLDLNIDTLDASDEIKDYIRSNRRGVGYWIWKPLALKQACRFASPGDIILYADSGTHINKSLDNIKYLIDGNRIIAFKLEQSWVYNITTILSIAILLLISLSYWGSTPWKKSHYLSPTLIYIAIIMSIVLLIIAIIIYNHSPYQQRVWTKRATVEEYFGYDYNKWYETDGKKNQIMGTFVGLKNGDPDAMRFLDLWSNGMSLDNAKYFDDSHLDGNSPHYKGSRHDQTMLSNILYAYYPDLAERLPLSNLTYTYGLVFHRLGYKIGN